MSNKLTDFIKTVLLEYVTTQAGVQIFNKEEVAEMMMEQWPLSKTDPEDIRVRKEMIQHIMTLSDQDIVKELRKGGHYVKIFGPGKFVFDYSK
jgi:hypothetical protein